MQSAIAKKTHLRARNPSTLHTVRRCTVITQSHRGMYRHYPKSQRHVPSLPKVTEACTAITKVKEAVKLVRRSELSTVQIPPLIKLMHRPTQNMHHPDGEAPLTSLSGLLSLLILHPSWLSISSEYYEEVVWAD